MHTLENVLLMLADEAKHVHHGKEWWASTLLAIAGASAEYDCPRDPDTGDPLDQFNRELINAFHRRRLQVEIALYMQRKRRAVWSEIRAHFIALECPEPDENYAPPDFKQLRRVLVNLVNRGELRRYGRAGYEYVPHRRRQTNGPRVLTHPRP
jgi:hypothetical protein